MTKTYPSLWTSIYSYTRVIPITACLTLILSTQCFFCSARSSESVTEDFNDIIEQAYSDYFYSQPDSAMQLFRIAAQQAQNTQRWDQQITALLQIAWCADYHSQIDTLQHYLSLTEQLLRQHSAALNTLDPDNTIRTDVAYTRGAFYYSSGDFPAAIDAFDHIVQPSSLAHIRDSLLVADVFAYLGSAYYRLQHYQKALDHYQVAEPWLPQQSEARDYQYAYRQALNALYRAQSYFAIGKYDQQEEAYDQGKATARQALAYLLPQKSNPRFRNPILSGANILSSIYQEQQHFDSALYYLELVLPLQGEENALLINTYNQLGMAHAHKQNYSKARAYYQRSQQIAEQLLPPKHFQRAIIYTLSGKLYAEQNQWTEALKEYQQALTQLVTEFQLTEDLLANPAYRDSGAKKELLEVLSYKAEALWGLYQQHPTDPRPLHSALEIYHQIGDILNQMRKVFPSIEYKQFIASRFFSIYEQAIRVAYEMHQRHDPDFSGIYLSEAFHFAEQSKSILLLEATQETQAKNYAGIPAELIEKEREYMRKRSLLERQLSNVDDPSSEAAAQLRQQILVTQDAYQDFLKRLEDRYPKYYALKHQTEVTSLSHIQSTLPEGSAMVSYYYGDSTIFSFGINSDTAFIHSVSLTETVTGHLNRLITFSSQYEWAEANTTERIKQWTNAGYAAYRQLVGTLLDSLSRKPDKLIIIPDGQLGYLSFDILLTDSIANGENARYPTLPYLLKAYPIRYEYSATLYAHQYNTTPSSPPQQTYAGFAPVYQESPHLLAENEQTRSAENDLSFSKLEFNKEEVEKASLLFDGKTFVDEQATEQAFKEHSQRSTILHLSMHAFTHDEDPMYSGLVFSQPATGEEDNLLYAYELYNIRLQANLAILSACETGVGKLARGEGIMSLGRAFKYAGCPNVAMSLWKVNDRTTQRVVQSFLEHLTEGQDKDEALRQAKLDFLSNAKGPLAHPYYWASLVLIGQDHPLKQYSSTWQIAGVIIIPILLLFLAFLILKKAKQGL